MSTSTRIYACGNPSCPNGAYFPQEQLDRDHTNRIWMSPYVFFQPKKDGTCTDTCNRPIRVYQSRLETNGVTHARLDKVQNGKDKWILTVFKGQTLPWKEIACPVSTEPYMSHFFSCVYLGARSKNTSPSSTLHRRQGWRRKIFVWTTQRHRGKPDTALLYGCHLYGCQWHANQDLVSRLKQTSCPQHSCS